MFTQRQFIMALLGFNIVIPAYTYSHTHPCVLRIAAFNTNVRTGAVVEQIQKCHDLDWVRARTRASDFTSLIPIAFRPKAQRCEYSGNEPKNITAFRAITWPIVPALCAVKYVNMICANAMCAHVVAGSSTFRCANARRLHFRYAMDTGHMYAVRTVCISSSHLRRKTDESYTK